jgi:hypothetical protein
LVATDRLAQPPAQLDAGEPRQHPVQHQQVGYRLLQARLGAIAIGDCLDGVPAFSKL